MVKKILVYRWGSLSEPSLLRAWRENGTDCVEFSMKLKDYHADAAFAEEMIKVIHKEKPDVVFSYDYFPVVSMLCEINRLPYAAWIYDCPQYTLLSGTVSNAANHIFCFDARYAEKIRSYGAHTVLHFPLAADTDGFERILSGRPMTSRKNRGITFVGDLYGGEKNRLRRARLSDYTAGYAEGLIRSQLLIYGCNLLGESMRENVAQEIVESCGLTLGEGYRKEPAQMAADAVGMEATAREREMILERLAGDFPVTLYTGSELPARWKDLKNLTVMGYADYEKEVPFIFRDSEINLNITSRTIESGIPQRVLDILACGGFCMTNFQPEIAEFFTDGQELVMYGGLEELMEKAAYYLKKENERKRIARKGRERVRKDFELKKRLDELLGCL